MIRYSAFFYDKSLYISHMKLFYHRKALYPYALILEILRQKRFDFGSQYINSFCYCHFCA